MAAGLRHAGLPWSVRPPPCARGHFTDVWAPEITLQRTSPSPSSGDSPRRPLGRTVGGRRGRAPKGFRAVTRPRTPGGRVTGRRAVARKADGLRTPVSRSRASPAAAASGLARAWLRAGRLCGRRRRPLVAHARFPAALPVRGPRAVAAPVTQEEELVSAWPV